MLHCENCNRIIMDTTTEGCKMRARMVLFTASGAVAVCPTCKHEVPVPIKLDPSGLLKSVNV